MIKQERGKSNSKTKKKPKWGKMAQQLKVSAMLPEDPTNCIITPVPGLKHIPLASEGDTHRHTHTQAYIHTSPPTHTHVCGIHPTQRHAGTHK